MQARSATHRYVVPLLGVGLATAVKLWSSDWFGRDVPFMLYWFVLAASGWRYGATGTWVALAGSVVAAWWFFFLPHLGPELPLSRALVELGGFVVEGTMIALIVHQLKRARRLADEVSEQRRAALDSETATRQWLEALAEIAVALSSSQTRERVAGAVVERAMRVAQADTCTLYELKPSRDLTLLAHAGIAPEIVERIRRLARDSNHPAFQIVDGEPVWVENEAQYAAISPDLARLETSRAKAFWSVPLLVEGKPRGLLTMGFYAPRTFSPADRAFTLTLGLHCAQALRRAELFERETETRRQAELVQVSLETTLRSIGDGVIATDTAGKVVFMNPVAEALTGFAEAEALGRPLAEVFRVVDARTRIDVESPATRVLRDNGVVALAEHSLLLGKQPGQETAIGDSAAPIRTPDGELLGVVLVFRDISQAQRLGLQRDFLADATRRLTASLDYETTLAQIAESVVPQLGDWCGIDIVDPQGGTLKRLAQAHIDPAKVALARELGLKYPPDPAAPYGSWNVIRTGRSEFYREISDSMLEQRASDAQHLRILKALELRSALIVPIMSRSKTFGTITLVYAESGRRYDEDDLAFAEEFARRAGAAIENSRLFLLEQESRAKADAASRAKDEFLATVSHELRTPLNAILGWARFLNREGVDPSKYGRGLDAVERNAQAMTALIEDLLDISRIVSGRLRLDPTTLNLDRVVDAALESARPNAEARKITLTKHAGPGETPVLGDAQRLQQVVANLLGNAVKFTDPGGRVHVELRRLGSVVELRIEDTGRGIDPAFLPQVFAPFRQADGSITRAHGGLGLGLAITKQLVELHHGSIAASSEGLGRGATFTVRLPLAATEQQAAEQRPPSGAEGPRPDELPSLNGLHVLIVDDDSDARELMRSLLESCGGRVTAADGVPAAMAALERETPDALVSDIGMPGENGYDLIRRVRSLPEQRARSIPALALTAFARSEDRQRVLRAGYLMHIPKPLEPAELVAAIANLARQTTAES